MNKNILGNDKRLILEALLESYRQRRMEIISFQSGYYKTLQLFLSGIFLLITYIIISQEYVLICIISFILLTMTHTMFYIFNQVTNIGSNAILIEYRINKLLGAKKNELIDYEIKWGGIAKIKYTRREEFMPAMLFLAIGTTLPFIAGGYFFYVTYDFYPFVFLVLGYIIIDVYEIKYTLNAIEYRVKINKKLIREYT